MHAADLPIELWALIANTWDPAELWRLYGTNRCARDGVLTVVMERESLRRGQAIAFFRVVHLHQNAFLTGGGDKAEMYRKRL